MARFRFRLFSWCAGLVAVCAGASTGCSSGPTKLQALPEKEPLEINVDCNTRVFPMVSVGRTVRLDGRPVAGRRIKFWVELVNNSEETIDLSDLEIELLATQKPRKKSRFTPPPGKLIADASDDDEERIHLRQTWRYRWATAIKLLPGRKLSIPIVPESQEFPLHHLSPGRYSISAVVNRKFESTTPYSLKIHRPEIQRLRPT